MWLCVQSVQLVAILIAIAATTATATSASSSRAAVNVGQVVVSSSNPHCSSVKGEPTVDVRCSAELAHTIAQRTSAVEREPGRVASWPVVFTGTVLVGKFEYAFEERVPAARDTLLRWGAYTVSDDERRSQLKVLSGGSGASGATILATNKNAILYKTMTTAEWTKWVEVEGDFVRHIGTPASRTYRTLLSRMLSALKLHAPRGVSTVYWHTFTNVVPGGKEQLPLSVGSPQGGVVPTKRDGKPLMRMCDMKPHQSGDVAKPHCERVFTHGVASPVGAELASLVSMALRDCVWLQQKQLIDWSWLYVTTEPPLAPVTAAATFPVAHTDVEWAFVGGIDFLMHYSAGRYIESVVKMVTKYGESKFTDYSKKQWMMFAKFFVCLPQAAAEQLWTDVSSGSVSGGGGSFDKMFGVAWLKFMKTVGDSLLSSTDRCATLVAGGKSALPLYAKTHIDTAKKNQKPQLSRLKSAPLASTHRNPSGTSGSGSGGKDGSATRAVRRSLTSSSSSSPLSKSFSTVLGDFEMVPMSASSSSSSNE